MFNKKDGFEKEMQKAEGETISSIVDKTMSITGEINFKGKTRIDGTINGNLNGEYLILSESGKIVGDVKVSSFICHGSIKGDIKANLVTARKGCTIHGKLEAGSLTVEPGATLDGEVKAATGTAKQDSQPAAIDTKS
jgi:cytoskeletal protein CcmA (bactofilin family)